MLKSMMLQSQTILYHVKKSSRAKRLRITVRREGSVMVTLPFFMHEIHADRFLKEKASWILKHLEKFKNFQGKILPKDSAKEILPLKMQAREIIMKKVYHFNSFYNFPLKNITIRKQKTRWGSCSLTGTLSFNYRMVHLADEIINYIVVHELCHLKEMNHSKNFWNLVAHTIPNYLVHRRALKKIIL